MPRKIQVLRLDSQTLHDLLEVAIADAAPDEVMPPFSDPGWTPARRQAFLDFFMPLLGTIYGITVDDALAGFTRLSPKGKGPRKRASGSGGRFGDKVPPLARCKSCSKRPPRLVSPR